MGILCQSPPLQESLSLLDHTTSVYFQPIKHTVQNRVILLLSGWNRPNRNSHQHRSHRGRIHWVPILEGPWPFRQRHQWLRTNLSSRSSVLLWNRDVGTNCRRKCKPETRSAKGHQADFLANFGGFHRPRVFQLHHRSLRFSFSSERQNEVWKITFYHCFSDSGMAWSGKWSISYSSKYFLE